MLCYATKLKVNNAFNETKLINEFYHFINEPKNQKGRKNRNYMHDLPDFNHLTLPFSYKVDDKEVYIQKSGDILALRYCLNEQRTLTLFGFDLLFDQSNRELHFHYFKEFSEDSVVITRVNIPNLFKTLMKSDFVELDHNFAYIPDRLHRVQESTILDSHFALPLIILRTNSRYHILNPKELTDRLSGIGHVVLLSNQKEHLKEIEVRYPNGNSDFIKNPTLLKVEEKIRAYGIDTFYNEEISFDALDRKDKLSKIYSENKQLNELHEETMEQKAKILLEKRRLTEENNLLKKQREELLTNIQNMQRLNEEDILIKVDSDKAEECYALLIKLLKQKYQAYNVDTGGDSRFRRRDVLADIFETGGVFDD